MSIIFGTDGWRGLLGQDMNDENVELVAQAFADYLNTDSLTDKSAAIGYDGRTKSKEFARLFASVLSANGIKVSLSDSVIPTPVLSFFVKAKSLSAGVMITASHNPAEYNGIKFKGSYGGPFLTEETLKVEKLLDNSPVRKNNDSIEVTDMLPVYISHIEKYIDFGAIKNSELTPLIDSMSGAGQHLLEEILKSKGCSATTIYGEPKSDFSGRSAEPIEKNLTPLMDALKNDSSFALGIATDGDADRLGAVMNGGEYLSAQEAILFLADYMVNIKRLPGNVVKTSSVTDKIRTYFEKDGRIVHDVQVGFKYICEKMISDEICFGAEESGGYGYFGHIPERDGILSGLLLLEMLSVSGLKKLSEYAAMKRREFGEIFYDRIDYIYKGSDRVEKLPMLHANPPADVCGFRIEKTETFLSSRGIINGLKFQLEGGERWLLLRASETEPMVRIYSEGRSMEEVRNFLNSGVKFIG
ncbi:MAG: phosphoglucomutase [Bacteroidota bacterium]